MTAVGEFRIAGSPDPWRRLGLSVVDDAARIGGVTMRFVPAIGDRHGIVGWGLVGSPSDATDIDGLATSHVDAPTGEAADHPLRIVGFDHVVVMTSALERTCGAIEASTGEPLKRIREAGSVRQGFHRLGEVIVEVVESSQVTSTVAAFWGLVWNVEDLHETCAELGPDIIGLPKAAVQPGRFIATVRSEVGLGLPLALMTPP